jgi:serine/threonine protein kinase
MNTTRRFRKPAHHDDLVTEIDALAAPSRRPAVGDVLAGRYELEARLGRTAAGDLFLARTLSLGTQVALHVYDDAITSTPALRARLCDEVQAAASVTHRHLGRILDFVAAEHSFVVLEHLGARSLATLLADAGPLPWRRAVRITIDISSILAAVHAAGLVHGRVEPANVMLVSTDEDEVVLGGFGFGARETVSGEAWTWTDVVGRPELGLGAPALDASADVQRLGCILYELLTGSRPTRGCRAARASRRLYKQLAQASDRTGDTMRALCAIVERAIADAPDGRFSSARELGDALRTLVRHHDRPGAVPRQRPIAALLALTVILASIAATAGFWYARVATGLPLPRP